MNKRSTRTRPYAPDPDAPVDEPCAIADCPGVGHYRAPRSPKHLRDYMWLCLDHVRAHNAAWDFYKGMSPGEIEAHLRADTQWQRPSWPMGQQSAFKANAEIFGEHLQNIVGGRRKGHDGAPAQAPDILRAPLAELGLPWPVTLAAVKSRYKELAKRHHPDANGGDKRAEERIKTINLAYATLRAHLPPDAVSGA